MTRIVLVHQGFELYGSDRTFIQCATAIRDAYVGAQITIFLPRVGALSEVLCRNGFEVCIVDLWILRRSYGVVGNLARLLQLPFAIANAARVFARSDIVYVNTSVVLDYLLAARMFRSKAVVHVHEIPTGAPMQVIRQLLKWSGAGLIYNSQATFEAFKIRATQSQSVLHNGCDGPEAAVPTDYDGIRPLRLLMLGRVNEWKGQDLLVEAIGRLRPAERPRIEVRVVGGVFGTQTYDLALRRLIDDHGLGAQISVLPFDDDPSAHYAWADLVIVPSRKPEPFGLVAIEAMAHARGVVAAAHGGLSEVVTDKVTGALVRPNDAWALADTIRSMVAHPLIVRSLGVKGRRRYSSHFTTSAMSRSFVKILSEKFPVRPTGEAAPAPAVAGSTTPTHILAVHQGYELYGSDRSFLEMLQFLRERYPTAQVEVILPATGPLSEVLSSRGYEVDVQPLWIIRRSYGVAGLVKRLFGLPRAVAIARARIRNADLVYINTCVVLDYYLAAHRSRHVIGHVREIPDGLALRVLRAVLRWSDARLIFNSQATADAFRLVAAKRTHVVHNGFSGPVSAVPSRYDGMRPLRLLVLGRINGWKGQDLLVSTLAAMTRQERSALELRIVGGGFGDERHDTSLPQLIEEAGLSASVQIFDFATDPEDHYLWSDVVVVPSKKPEPFGRVAIEAGAYSRPVIAAAHGGLVEIVKDGVSGTLFQPNDEASLAQALRSYLQNPERVAAFGCAGRRTFLAEFSEEALRARVMEVLRQATEHP